MGKELVYQGVSYSSYYQLEKIMGVSRRTIQYRHEKIGIPLDEVPSYVAKPPMERLGIKPSLANKNENKRTTKVDELQAIIDYPKAPEIYIGEDEKRVKESLESYKKWLSEAPKTLALREQKLYQTELNLLIKEENEKWFYASTLHESQKKAKILALEAIKDVERKTE
ncbi:TPA: hypothetical protein QFM54_001870 [Enterococcus faecium]